MIRTVTTAFALVLATGCALHVELQNPKPNIDLDKSATPLAFSLAPEVQDIYTVPPQGGLQELNVAQWRQTLTAGFKNGFGSYYAIAPTAPNTLELATAELSFVSAAVNGGGGVVAANAQITFKARLLDAQGKAVCRSARTVESKSSITRPDGAGPSASSAVETMFEAIAHDCFEHAPAHASR